VTELRSECFAFCRSLSVVVFEFGSRLSRIDPTVFIGCSRISSARITRCIRSLFREGERVLIPLTRFKVAE
jgi:hypothetical protein